MLFRDSTLKIALESLFLWETLPVFAETSAGFREVISPALGGGPTDVSLFGAVAGPGRAVVAAGALAALRAFAAVAAALGFAAPGVAALAALGVAAAAAVSVEFIVCH